MKVDEATVLISGGAGGLGAAAARTLAHNGANVVIADHDEVAGEAVAKEIDGQFVATDVTDESQVARAVGVAAAGSAPLRVALCCAGISPASRTVGRRGEVHGGELFDRVVRVNLTGTHSVLRHAAAAIRHTEPHADGERGVVVTTSSITAWDGQVGQGAYAASKAAVAGLTLPAARDLAPFGIRVCSIAPGMFNTPLVAALPEVQKSEMTRDIIYPKRLGYPYEYAHIALTIIENTYLNGSTIRLDGALRLPPM